MTKIAIEIDGLMFSAVLHDDAPRGVRRFLDALPVTGALRHSRWSGETVYLADARLVDRSLQPDSTTPPTERPASILCPGTLHYGPARGNIGLPYGQAQSRAIGGANTYGILLGTIETRDGYVEALRAIRRRPARVTIRRM